jgi:hypothetical protein
MSDLSDLSGFNGTGTFDLGVFALAATSIRGSGSLSGGADTSASASDRVNHDDTARRQAVPEPGLLVLVDLALAALLLSRRRAGANHTRRQQPYDFLPSPVPEPATWALLLSGMALMRWLVSRRKT